MNVEAYKRQVADAQRKIQAIEANTLQMEEKKKKIDIQIAANEAKKAKILFFLKKLEEDQVRKNETKSGPNP